MFCLSLCVLTLYFCFIAKSGGAKCRKICHLIHISSTNNAMGTFRLRWQIEKCLELSRERCHKRLKSSSANLFNMYLAENVLLCSLSSSCLNFLSSQSENETL